MKYLLMFIFLCDISYDELVFSYSVGKMRTVVKIHKFGLCKKMNKDTINPIELKLSQIQYQQFVSGKFSLNKDLELARVEIIISRCSLEKINCRIYLHLNVTEIEAFAYRKNSPWSNFTYSIHPRITFPILKKGQYTVENATYDPSVMLLFHPDALEYDWTFDFNVFNKKNNLEMCGEIEITKMQTIVKIHKFDVCSAMDKDIIGEAYFIINQIKYQQYASGSFMLNKNLEIDRVEMNITQCSLERTICRKYVNWNIVELDKVAYHKNTLWSNFTYSIHPRPTFPIMKKGKYEVRNATFDSGTLLQFYPDVVNHYWIFTYHAYNRNNYHQICGQAEITLLQFLERRRG